MKHKGFLHILIFFLLACSCQLVLAQKKKGFKAQALAASEQAYAQQRLGFYITFPNVNKIPFYFNQDELKKISALEKKKDFVALLPVLEQYVRNFGIQNFSRNIDMLWKLGQLYEINGQKSQSIYLYQIALKHHKPKQGDQIEQHYDSLVVKDEYVPLEYYYDLVEYRRSIDTLVPPQNVFLNMGELINDKKYPDYGPAMNVQGNMLIYTKRKKELTATKLAFRENEDLYYSINYDGFWDEAQPFSNVINSHCNEGSATISRDGKTLYFARCKVTDFQYDCRDCIGSCDIYVSHLEDSVWSVPQNLGATVNTIYWDSHPTLSHTEDTLYFASDRLGGFGLSDIWFTHKLLDGSWAPAENLGPVVNTRGNDVSPFYHPEHHVLYFSSNGQLLNFGDVDSTQKTVLSFDIYKTRHIAGMFDEPRNIGPLVNGKGDEYYFAIDTKGKDLFYAKSEVDDIKNLDLYSFPLPMEAQALAYTKFSGSLRDSLSEDPFSGIVSVIDLTNGIEVSPKFMRPDGTFEFDLIPENEYLLVIQGDDFFRVEHQFTLNGDTTINLMTNSIKYNKWKFASLEFDNNSSNIKPEMETDLNKVVDFMLDHPYLKVSISGHTDSDGDPNANLKLSKERAVSIRNYVIEKGKIDPDRILAEGYGNQKPIVEEKTPEDKRINRRVEFEIIKLTQEEIEQQRAEEKAKRKQAKEDELFDEFENEGEEKTPGPTPQEELPPVDETQYNKYRMKK
ncbi:MAG: yiaD [Chitinophagaceae bacterium]|nr:yiaD [Chitinophagaceae bacterium]